MKVNSERKYIESAPVKRNGAEMFCVVQKITS